MDLNFIDGSISNVVSEQDIVGIISLGIPIGDKLGIGCSAKAMFSTLVGTKSAISIGGDLGIRYKGFLMDDLNLGISLMNLGTGLKYLDTVESLPLNIQGGASYGMDVIEDLKVIGAVDGVYDINEKRFELKAGIEGKYAEFSVRVGMPFIATDIDESFAAGVGYTLENQYMFDYGVTFGKALGLSHRVSVGMIFEDEGIRKPKTKK